MSNTTDIKGVLKEHKVVPDVLSEPFELKYGLTIKWPNVTLDTPGQELDREETQAEPEVYLDPAPTEQLNNLVLIMTDPDLMLNNDTYFGQIRHYLSANLSSTPVGTLSHHTAAHLSPYIGPAPLPNYLYARPHRYIFILAQPKASTTADSTEPGQIAITPQDFRDLQKPYVAAVAGNKDGFGAQDLKDRWGFNASGLLEMKGLEVVGVTFMRVGGTLRGAGANAGMMGKAVVDKILGR